MTFRRQRKPEHRSRNDLAAWSASMSLSQQLRDYRLTTAEILYHLPDHPSVLQSYIWQELDLAPEFPVLHKFLDFWGRNLDGKLYSVRIVSAGIMTPRELRFAGTELMLQ